MFHELSRAIDAGAFWLAYQPKVSLGSRQLTGVEALLRWEHPVLGLVSPAEFIPLAEKTGLIEPITEWVFRTALRQWLTWRDGGLSTRIALNVSVKSLACLDFPDRVHALCCAFGVPSDHVIVEVTETATTEDTVTMMDAMTRLRLKGFSVSIDDFGAGYSSLVQLQRMPFSELKIDRSLVQEITASADSLAIVRAITNLAHELSLRVVAEGVETRQVFDRLVELGCDEAQGYYIARPIPFASAAQLLAWEAALA